MANAFELRLDKKYKKDRKLGRIYLFLFFLFVGLHKLDQIQWYYTGVSIKKFTIITPLFIPPLFLLLALLKYRKIHVKTKVTNTLFQFYFLTFLFISYIFYLVSYGVVVGNPAHYISTEVWIYLIVILCLFLGHYDAVWKDIYKPLIVLFWLFCIPVYFGTFIPRLHLIAEGSAEYLLEKKGYLGATATLAYEMYPILDFFPIVFVLSAIRKKIDIWKILGLCTVIGYLGFHIFFQKRAPSVRALTYIVVILGTIQLVKPSIESFLKPIGFGAIAIFFLLSIVSVDGLVDRLNKSDQDDSRQNEVGIMLNQLEPHEWIFGKGFGGYFILGSDDIYGLGEYEIKEGVFGKVNLHIAFFYPILKGGLIFLLLTLLFSFPLIYRWLDRTWLSNEYNFTAFNILIVIFLFQFIEGPFSSGVTFLGVLYGLCWGKVATSLNQFSLKRELLLNVKN